MTEAKPMVVTFACNGQAVSKRIEGKNPARTTMSAWSSLSDDERDVLALEDGDTVEVEVSYEVTVRKAASFTVHMRPTLEQAEGFKVVRS